MVDDEQCVLALRKDARTRLVSQVSSVSPPRPCWGSRSPDGFGDGDAGEFSQVAGNMVADEIGLLLLRLPLIHPRTRIFCENSRLAAAIACIAIMLSTGRRCAPAISA